LPGGGGELPGAVRRSHRRELRITGKVLVGFPSELGNAPTLVVSELTPNCAFLLLRGKGLQKVSVTVFIISVLESSET
jgi:hypothetical protein